MTKNIKVAVIGAGMMGKNHMKKSPKTLMPSALLPLPLPMPTSANFSSTKAFTA